MPFRKQFKHMIDVVVEKKGKRRTALDPVKQKNQGRTSQAGMALIYCE